MEASLCIGRQRLRPGCALGGQCPYRRMASQYPILGRAIGWPQITSMKRRALTLAVPAARFTICSRRPRRASRRMTDERIRVLCVDDHQVVREGIELIISRQADMTVVASAGTAEEAVAQFIHHRPHVTLLALRLGTSSGIDAIRAIRRHDPAARIVVLTIYQGDEDIHNALSAGATTYLLKDALSEELIRVVREVHGGGQPMGADVKAKLDQRAA